MQPREPKPPAGTFSRLLHTAAAAVSLLLPTLKLNAAEAPANAATRPADGRDTPNASHAPAGDSDRAALEKRFADVLTGATMVGKYTVEGSDAAPKEDRYRITKAVKADGDNWTITSSIEYKGFGIPVSLTIPVKWAGDTPVMTVTDEKIPAVGTFTARVLFYNDHYVGTWDGGHGHAGTLWGRIEHDAKGDKAGKADNADKADRGDKAGPTSRPGH